MTTPLERLEERKRLAECSTCAWLETLSAEDRAEWQKAIMDRRFGGDLISSEILVEVNAREAAGTNGYSGRTIGAQSILNHRQRGHQ
jgi:hypothetical protein